LLIVGPVDIFKVTMNGTGLAHHDSATLFKDSRGEDNMAFWAYALGVFQKVAIHRFNPPNQARKP
jgi:hypothetical protein